MQFSKLQSAYFNVLVQNSEKLLNNTINKFLQEKYINKELAMVVVCRDKREVGETILQPQGQSSLYQATGKYIPPFNKCFNWSFSHILCHIPRASEWQSALPSSVPNFFCPLLFACPHLSPCYQIYGWPTFLLLPTFSSHSCCSSWWLPLINHLPSITGILHQAPCGKLFCWQNIFKSPMPCFAAHLDEPHLALTSISHFLDSNC